MQRNSCWSEDAAAQVVPADAEMGDAAVQHPRGRVSDAGVPLCLTCAIIQDRLVADPSLQEEALAATTVSITVDGKGDIVGAHLQEVPACGFNHVPAVK